MSVGRRPRRPWLQPLLLLLRLAVMGVGLGVLVSTALKTLAPRLAQGSVGVPQPDSAPRMVVGQGMALGRFEPRTELTALSQEWARLAAAQKGLTASGFLLVLDDGRYAQLKSDLPMPAASSIKSPILLVGLDELDRGKVRWNEPLPLTKDVMGEGAGWMANKPLGTRFPFFEAATEMIRVSDNSATNLLIKRLGGLESVNTPGLFPGGEGAGYAGGILSAAIDGIKLAEAVGLSLLRPLHRGAPDGSASGPA